MREVYGGVDENWCSRCVISTVLRFCKIANTQTELLMQKVVQRHMVCVHSSE